MSAQPDLEIATSARPRVAFVGLGWIGVHRLQALDLADVDVAALVDSDPQRLMPLVPEHPQATIAHDIDELLMSADAAGIDGVVIATPNGLHAQQALACLERGLPVFCQKPLATSLGDVEQVIAAARHADRLLGIDFCYRHVSGMADLRRRLREGELGKIVAVDLTFHNAYGPDKSWCRDRRLAGGGCLLDLGVHLLDLALWLQDMPQIERVRSRLFAQGEPVQGREGELEDLAYAEFIQANGAIVRLGCSWHAHIGQPAQIQVSLSGTRAGAVWRNVSGSFFDFELHLLQGDSRRRLGGAPDEWGPRSLTQWLRQLRASNRFDPAAEQIMHSAALIDEVYRV
jgi:predicted dehydrogenase